jgi:hypothetical protein
MIEGIFVGPQVTQLLKDQDFNTQLNLAERRAWKTFEKSVCRSYKRNEKVDNCSEIVQELISSYSSLGCTCHRNLIFCIHIWIFFRKTWKPSTMNMAKGSTRIFPKLKRDAVEN